MKKKTPGKTYSLFAPASFMFPIRNLRAACYKAVKEAYPDALGMAVWTAVKGERPQVIEVGVLKVIISTLDDMKLPSTANVRIKITHSTAGLCEVKVGSGPHAVTFRYTSK